MERDRRALRRAVQGRHLRPLEAQNNFGANGWGALQLGVRYSKFDASDFTSSNGAGTGVLGTTTSSTADGVVTPTNEADAWTLGANWILTPNTRLMMNYVHTGFDTPITVRVNNALNTLDSENALTLRAQFDF